MSNHLHLIAKARTGSELSSIIRDLKKFTAHKIINEMKEISESRREWILKKFVFAGKRLRRISGYKFWKDDNHAILLDNNELIDQKLEYIHHNPIEAMLVDRPQHYVFSSARDYYGERGLVEIELLN